MDTKILSSAFGSLTVRVLGAVAALAFQFVLARDVGAEGSGYYYFVISVVLLLSTISRLGLDRMIPKSVAIAIVHGDRKQTAKSINESLLLVVLASTLVVALVLVVLSFSEQYVSDMELLNGIRLGVLFLIFVSLNWYLSGVLVGLKSSINASLIQTVIVPFVSIALLLAFDNRYGLRGPIIAFGFGNILTFFLALYFTRQHISLRSLKPVGVDLKQSFLAIADGFPVMVNVLATQAILFCPILVLGFSQEASQTGVFAIAQRTALTVGIVLFVSNIILAPRVAALWSNNNREAIGDLAGMAGASMCFVCLPILVPLLVIPETIMGLFGVGFKQGAGILFILALAQVVNILTTSVEQIMTMTGHQKQVMHTAVTSAAVSTALSLVAIPLYGIVGAACTFSITVIGLNIWRVYLFWRSTGINVLPKQYMFLNPRKMLVELRSY